MACLVSFKNPGNWVEMDDRHFEFSGHHVVYMFDILGLLPATNCIASGN